MSTFCHCLHIFSIKKATIYFNRVGEDLVGYLGLRGLSIPISLEIDAEVNNERVRATCYLLLAYLLLCLLLLLFPRRLLYISLSYSPSLPFSPPPLPISFLFFLGGGRGGREVGGGGKGGDQSRRCPPNLYLC